MTDYNRGDLKKIINMDYRIKNSNKERLEKVFFEFYDLYKSLEKSKDSEVKITIDIIKDNLWQLIR